MRRVVEFLEWPPRRRELLRWVGWIVALIGAVVLLYVVAAPSEQTCRDQPLRCGVEVNLVTTIAVAGVVGVFWFWLRTRLRVTRIYLNDMRARPEALLETAPPAHKLERMEPPEDLNDRIARELRHLPALNLQVIEGDAGSGKTVALLKLADHLARRGCVPVLVSLRGATMPLDFMVLAQRQFLRVIDHRLASDSDGDRLWRQLCRSRLLVILADGLDDIVAGEAVLDSQSLFAFRPDDRHQIPVVLACRRRTLPEEWRASVFGIGAREDPQLTEEQVTRYLHTTAELDTRTGGELARQLELGRTPLYIDVVARMAEKEGALPSSLPDDVRAARRVILDAFVDALAADGLGHGGRMDDEERHAAIEAAGRLAFSLLLSNEDGVPISDLERHGKSLLRRSPAEDETPVRVVARAKELGLLRIRRFGETTTARFRHPILQAHLAARAMDSLGRLEDGRPAWAHLAAVAKTEEAFLTLQTYAARTSDSGLGEEMCAVLLEGARTRPKGLRVSLSMCAAEVARECRLKSAVPEICKAATDGWPHASPSAKLLAVEALVRLGDFELEEPPSEPLVPTTLWHLAGEQPHLVEWRLVRAISGFGEKGYTALSDEIHERLADIGGHLERNPGATEGDRVLDRAYPTLKVLGKFLPRLTDEAPEARGALGRLVEIVELLRGRKLGIEASLGQGFKEAARCGDRADTDELIIALAGSAKFWFTRINAIQALTRRAVRSPPDHKSGADPVRAALTHRAAHDAHPYVRRSASLCLRALDKPADVDRYVWDDESEAVAVASDGLSADAHRLLGQIVLLLNMNEQRFPETERRLEPTQKAVGERSSLPYCLGKESDRERLLLRAGDDPCPQNFRCTFRLCPYRPGFAPLDSAYRELSADFCRHERSLARALSRRRAREHRFWQEIEQRSRAAAVSRLP